MITDRQRMLIETKALAAGSIDEDGGPNVIAVGFVKVMDGNKIIITDNYMRRTADNLKRDPRVCLAVWTDDWEEGYKVIGKVEYFSQGQWLDYVKNMKENEGCPAKVAIIIHVNAVYSLGG